MMLPGRARPRTTTRCSSTVAPSGGSRMIRPNDGGVGAGVAVGAAVGLGEGLAEGLGDVLGEGLGDGGGLGEGLGEAVGLGLEVGSGLMVGLGEIEPAAIRVEPGVALGDSDAVPETPPNTLASTTSTITARNPTPTSASQSLRALDVRERRSAPRRMMPARLWP